MRRREKRDSLRKALAEARRSRGLTQSKVAELLGRPQSFVSKYESGERRLDVIDFLEVCDSLSTTPEDILSGVNGGGSESDSILRYWGLTESELSDIVNRNPSLRGILIGYVAEKKLQDIVSGYPGVTRIRKDDDHDRTRKGDRRITYKGQRFTIEVKSLQTNSVKDLGDDRWTGKAQVDASDRREVTFPDGSTLATTCLRRGEFDILAVNCFAFGGQWRFAFALNAELPPNVYAGYTEYQRQHLLPTLIRVDWPLEPPFHKEATMLLGRLSGHAS